MTTMTRQLRILVVLFTLAGALGLGTNAVSAAEATEASLPNLHRQLSDRGLSFLERHEGFVGHLYNDSAGNCTIGYGHLLHHGACGSADRARYRHGITRARARDLLRRDADVAERSVQHHVRVPLNQHRFDALVSFTFNVGTGAFEGSTLLRVLNQRHYDGVPAQLMRWTIGGLEQRRADEVRLWRDGRYS
jgi:GH24 family phage-related lysozyme (muramidase)